MLQGVGPRISKLLDDLAGPRIADLLWQLPYALIDRRANPALNRTSAQTFIGHIVTLTLTIDSHHAPARRSLPYRVRCSDDKGGHIELTFFNVKGDYLDQILPVGGKRVVSGRLESYQGSLQMPHPDYIVPPDEAAQIPSIEPIYPLTAGITHKMRAKIMRNALPKAPPLPEWLDDTLLKREGWSDWHSSLMAAHHPQQDGDIDPQNPARQRLAYDEILSNQLTIELVRLQQTRARGHARAGDAELIARARTALPFSLTGAQERAVVDIAKDLASEDKMHRLLQGDVGSGKTAVAFLAMVQALGSANAQGQRAQAAIMAPTEILARQHEKNISAFAQKCGLTVATLTGRDKGKAREKILTDIASGQANIVIGTHALFQEDIAFHDLALVVIDEQHRFGVHQRLQLSEKGHRADVLVMTATPIPRTLTLTVYGDMDVSRLDEKPPGRQPIDTALISNERMGEVIGALERKIASGARIYWVCPLVEESEKIDLAAAADRHADLRDHFGDRVGLLHGRMKPAEKDSVMAAFAAGDLDILVATTVIEVGVDVPEATVMVIEHAERFGLAQLHQLRGRIGRGSGKSSCLLMFAPNMSEIARKRLSTIRDTEDGFVIAEEDLKLRGAGEMLGTRQSGLPEMRFASHEHHGRLFDIAFQDARHFLSIDPQLESPRGQNLRVLLYLFERDMAIKYLRTG